MKKLSMLAILLTLCAVMMLQACTPHSLSDEAFPHESTGTAPEDTAPKDYGKYESIAQAKADAVFNFKTNLPEKQLYPLSSGGKTYYVSSSGSSSNDGLSPERPITLSDVGALSLRAGDSVLFKKGDVMTGSCVVSSKSGTENNPITFASYGEGDARPHIHAGAANAMTFERCSNIVVRDLEISVDGMDFKDGSKLYYGIYFIYRFVGDERFENIYIVNNVVHSIGTERDVTGIRIDSVEKEVETRPREVVKNIYIYNNTVYNLGRSGISVTAWMISLERSNTFHDTYRNAVISGNEIYDVGNIGTYIIGCTDSEISRNTVYRTGMRKKSENAEGECGIMVLGCDTSDIMFNICYDNRRAGTPYDAMGIDIDWNTTNINVQYNYCYENEGSGIGTMACQNSFIRNNRVENNKGDTNHQAQIQVGNFTSYNACVADDMHAVKNLTVEKNLIIGSPILKNMFAVKHLNGDVNFENDIFRDNRLVYVGEDYKHVRWIHVDKELAWYEFSGNKYFGSRKDIFDCFDKTPIQSINTSLGAVSYPLKEKIFEEWLLREPDAEYILLTDFAPSAPGGGNVTYADGKLKITWESSVGDVWHYNLYATRDGEDVSYTNMIGEAFGTEFEYYIETKGEFNIVIQPESNEGVCGKAIKLKVVIE